MLCRKHKLSISEHTPYGCLVPFTRGCRFPAAYAQPPTAGSSKRQFDLHVIRGKDWSLQIFSTLHASRPVIIFIGRFARFYGCNFHPSMWSSKRFLQEQKGYCHFITSLSQISVHHSLVCGKTASSALLLSIKGEGSAGALPHLASVGWYKLSEVFYSAYHRSIKALKRC